MDDDTENNLVAAGAVWALLHTTKAGYRLIPGQGSQSLTSAEVVTDEMGNATNQIDITLSFMASPYRLTVERVT